MSRALTAEENAQCNALRERLHRAKTAIRRATKRNDAAGLVKANAAKDRATAALTAFTVQLGIFPTPPQRIRYITEARWTYGATHGTHRHDIEMVLDHLDVSGPEYRTVRVIGETGAPPQNPRPACDIMGIAWFAIPDAIREGRLIPLTDGGAS